VLCVCLKFGCADVCVMCVCLKESLSILVMGKKKRGKKLKKKDGKIRIAIVNQDKCKPKKCKQECKRMCPVVRMGNVDMCFSYVIVLCACVCVYVYMCSMHWFYGAC